MVISVNCKLLLYADDSALIISGPDPKTIAESLSVELDSCRKWLIDNKLSWRTEAILFGSKKRLRKVNEFEVRCNNEVIKQVSNVKYLGLQLDSHLSGERTVSNILKKTNSRLIFL